MIITIVGQKCALTVISEIPDCYGPSPLAGIDRNFADLAGHDSLLSKTGTAALATAYATAYATAPA